MADPVLVQKATGGNVPSPVSAMFPVTPTAGNLLVAIFAMRTAGAITGPAGWTEAINQASDGITPGQAIFFKVAGPGEPQTVTVTTTASGSGTGLQIYEYSGLTGALDGVGSAVGMVSPTSSGSVAVAAGKALLVAALVNKAGTLLSAWTNAFAEQANFTGGSGGGLTRFGGADRVASAPGTYSTAAASGNDNWRGQVAAFTAAADPGPEQGGKPMAVQFVQEGSAVDYTPGADVAVGDVVVQGDLVGVAKRPIPAGTLGALSVVGIFEFPKATGAGSAIAVGAKVYWNATTKVATTSDGAGANKFLGKVAKAAADADATVQVRLSQ